MEAKQNNQETQMQPQEQTIKNTYLLELQKEYQTQRDELIPQIKNLNAGLVVEEGNEEPTEEFKQETQQKMDDLTKRLLIIEKKIEIVDQIREQSEMDNHTKEEFRECVEKGVNQYDPTQEQIATRKQELLLDPNESGWTDATESQADGEQIWFVDDNIIQAMQNESDGEEEGQDDKGESQSEEQIQQKKEQINYDQLEEQFVTGGESDHIGLYGKHDKFCVSVNGLSSSNLLFSGGGDDYLYFYKMKDENQLNPAQCIKPYHLLKHSQTINKIDLSYSKQYVFSMTENQILCTQLKTLETSSLKKKEKEEKKQEEQDSAPICSDMVCHHLGDVVAVSSDFELQIYNIKGLKLYQTYYCEKSINMFRFTETGKQLCLACEDNKIRLLTAKSGQFVTIGGINQHKSQISAMVTKGNIILTGCIDGYVGVSNIKNNMMTALLGTKETDEIYGSINHLHFAGNYFIAGAAQECIDWYDLTKTKRIFHSEMEGSSTDLIWQGADNQHLYSVSTIKGYIYLYDCRNPLKQINRVRAGNTIHKLWTDKHHLAAACEDGNVRYYDIRKIIV